MLSENSMRLKERQKQKHQNYINQEVHGVAL